MIIYRNFNFLLEYFFTPNPGPFNLVMIELYNQPDFWLWFYLVFVISSTMLPSASDRKAWIPLGVFLTALIVLFSILGAGNWMAINILAPVDRFFYSVASIFAVSLLVHLLLLPPVAILRRILNRITGLQVISPPDDQP